MKSSIADAIGAAIVNGTGSAEVYSTATKYAQARLLFDEAHNMIKQSPALSKHFRKRKNDLYYEPTMSKFQPLARNSDTLDGLNASFVIMDELHGVKDRNLYEVMRQSMADGLFQTRISCPSCMNWTTATNGATRR